MNREFLEFYDRELKLLYEQGAEFAKEYPGVGERLGGLLEDRSDPMMIGVLEGAAFLAARVQLKIKHEFSEFTHSLLDQLVPNYLAPVPSAMLAQVKPVFGDPALRDGKKIDAGSYIDATYQERNRRIACRYRLTSGITIWPFEVTGAEYVTGAARLQALGLPARTELSAGLRISLTHRSTPDAESEPSDAETAKKPEIWAQGCRTSELPFHILGPESDAVQLYEQLFANCIGVHFRRLDEFGNPVVDSYPASLIAPKGFTDEETLLSHDRHVFHGFDLLLEYFNFPRKFLAFNLTGLRPAFAKLPVRSFDIILSFNRVNERLQAAVQPGMLALYTAPAVNLFDKQLDRIQVKSNQHEYHVIPDRTRYLEFEVHRLLDLQAHYPGGLERRPIAPLYSASLDRPSHANGLYYTMRRLRRRRSTAEVTGGSPSDYLGSDVFLSLLDPGDVDEAASIAEVSARALCSNRHLPELLPVGESGADFRFLDDTSLPIVCAAGPTRPSEAIGSKLKSSQDVTQQGTVAWRLINMLSLNHLGLVGRGGGRDAAALKEVLSLFGDLGDKATSRKISGVRSVESREIVRRLQQRAGVGAARGIEITVTLSEKEFEGSGIFVLGAILDRFFSEYAALNHFTQTIISSVERGVIMRWPPRLGERRPL